MLQPLKILPLSNSHLSGEVTSLRHELADSRTERSRMEEESNTVKEQLAQLSEEKEAMGAKVEQLQGEVGSKQEDIQAKTKLIAKVCVCQGITPVVCCCVAGGSSLVPIPCSLLPRGLGTRLWVLAAVCSGSRVFIYIHTCM